jgi:hypothetical protein
MHFHTLLVVAVMVLVVAVVVDAMVVLGSVENTGYSL